MATLRLGLFGAGISRSAAPRFHVLAGRLCGLDVTYERFDLEGREEDFEAAVEQARDIGVHAVNITHPLKERAFALCEVPDAEVARLGAVNTVLFHVPREGRPLGYNTDWPGFKTGFVANLGGESPGVAAVVGCGGVARAVGFGLLELGATELRLFDIDAARAASLAAALREAGGVVRLCEDVAEAVRDVDGIANCTPVGMWQHPGTPVPAALIDGQRWAFDAIYTPRETEFLRDVRAAGLAVMDGWELLLYQGVDCFRLFSGHALEVEAIRAALAEPE